MSMLKIRNQHGGWDEIVAIRGRDGAIQYTAGANIEITPDNVISAKGLANSVTREDVTEMINASVPKKVSDLPNDAGYITSASVPTKTSELNNDAGYITSADVPKVPTKTSELTNDSGFVNSSAIPTKTSELTNDSNFATLNDIPTVPTKLSELTNDAGYLKSSDVGTGLLTINRNNVAIGTFNANETINKTVNIVVPTTTSELTNDAGFVNNSAISGTVEDILSNKGYITEETEPAFKASAAATITQGNIDSWNSKQNALSISPKYNETSNPIATIADIPTNYITQVNASDIGKDNYIKLDSNNGTLINPYTQLKNMLVNNGTIDYKKLLANFDLYFIENTLYNGQLTTRYNVLQGDAYIVGHSEGAVYNTATTSGTTIAGTDGEYDTMIYFKPYFTDVVGNDSYYEIKHVTVFLFVNAANILSGVEGNYALKRSTSTMKFARYTG